MLLVANVAEEGEGNLAGMRYLCRQSPLAKKIDSFVVIDGADTDHITTRGLGSRRFELSFTGPGGHSWSDYGVANPLHALCRAVSLFSDTRCGEHSQVGAERGCDRRWRQHQRHRPIGPRQDRYPFGKQ